MLFKDLYSTFINLKCDTIVKVTKGSLYEGLTAIECFKKYGKNEVVCFGMYGDKSQILTVTLK